MITKDNYLTSLYNHWIIKHTGYENEWSDHQRRVLMLYQILPLMYHKYDMKASEENMHVDVRAERVKQVVTRYIFVRWSDFHIQNFDS